MVGEFANPALTKIEISLLQIVKQVGTLHVVQHNIVVFTIFKQVDQVYDVGMLAHLKDLNFSSLLEYFNIRHVLLLDLFDGHFLFGFLVGCKLD